MHHAAFDARLIEIDPDYRMHAAKRLMAQNNRPLIEALKPLDGRTIKMPERQRDRPHRDRLATRYDLYRRAA